MPANGGLARHRHNYVSIRSRRQPKSGDGKYLLLAQSGHPDTLNQCLLLITRTFRNIRLRLKSRLHHPQRAVGHDGAVLLLDFVQHRHNLAALNKRDGSAADSRQYQPFKVSEEVVWRQSGPPAHYSRWGIAANLNWPH